MGSEDHIKKIVSFSFIEEEESNSPGISKPFSERQKSIDVQDGENSTYFLKLKL